MITITKYLYTINTKKPKTIEFLKWVVPLISGHDLAPLDDLNHLPHLMQGLILLLHTGSRDVHKLLISPDLCLFHLKLYGVTWIHQELWIHLGVNFVKMLWCDHWQWMWSYFLSVSNRFLDKIKFMFFEISKKIWHLNLFVLSFVLSLTIWRNLKGKLSN